MRILCTADLQIGAGASYLEPKHGPGSRLDDHARAWVDAVRLAIDHQASAIIVAGDVFEEKRPGPTALLAFQRGVGIARDHGIQVIAIAGNHDVRSADEPTALEVFSDVAGDDTLTSPEDGLARVHRIPAVHFISDTTAYAVLPWTTMGGIAAHFGGGDRDLLHAEAGEKIVQVARGLREQIRLAGAEHAILVAHWAVSGAAMPTGLPTDELREVIIPAHALVEQEWDAVVLGHIHRPQTILEPAGGLRFYCGSPLPCDFGEAGYQHGCYLLELGPLLNELTFLPIESRPFVTLTTYGLADGYDNVPDGAIVRVVGRVTEAENETIDRPTLEQALRVLGAAAVRIDVEVERETRARADHVTKDLGPDAALDAWITTQKPDVDHATMRARHHGYLEQEAAA